MVYRFAQIVLHILFTGTTQALALFEDTPTAVSATAGHRPGSREGAQLRRIRPCPGRDREAHIHRMSPRGEHSKHHPRHDSADGHDHE